MFSKKCSFSDNKGKNYYKIFFIKLIYIKIVQRFYSWYLKDINKT